MPVGLPSTSALSHSLAVDFNMKLTFAYFITYRPTTNAIMGLTFANYVIKPFFPDCDNPDQAVRLLAAGVICIIIYDALCSTSGR
jgi:hypothetical protein